MSSRSGPSGETGEVAMVATEEMQQVLNLEAAFVGLGATGTDLEDH